MSSPPSSVVQSLLQSSSTLSLSAISPDHSTITLHNNATYPSSTQCTFPKTTTTTDGGDQQQTTTMLTYSLLSLLLQIYNPNITLMQYRNICKTYKVKDAVKTLDKETVLRYFRGDSAVTTTAGGGEPAASSSAAPTERTGDGRAERKRERSSKRDPDETQQQRKERHEKIRRQKEDRDRRKTSERDGKREKREDGKREKRDRGDRDRDRDRDREKDKKRRSSRTSSSAVKEEGSARKAPLPKVPITQVDLLQNLRTVVDKRSVVKKAKKEGDVKDGDVVMADGDFVQQEGGETMDGSEKQQPTTSDQPREDSSNQNQTIPKKEDTTQKEDLLSVEEDLEEQNRRITECLSCNGYQAEDIPPEILERDQTEVDKIMAFEIPVGDSASVLRCGAPSMMSSAGMEGSNGGKGGTPIKVGMGMGGMVTPDGDGNRRDFKRVLTLYNEAEAEELAKEHAISSSSNSKHGSRGTPHSKRKTPTTDEPPKQDPIIIVPNAMTSAITMVNAHKFFQESIFQTRQQMLKSNGGRKNTKIQTVTRNVSSRLGGSSITYELMDNPSLKLKTKSDWDRVVAVIPQGAAWQFKGWKMGPSAWKSTSSSAGGGSGPPKSAAAPSPVDVFANAFGFYVGYEGTPLPKDLQGWSVKKGIVSRDKRGFDSVVLASFWNGLDEWMTVHKRDYLPKSGDL